MSPSERAKSCSAAGSHGCWKRFRTCAIFLKIRPRIQVRSLVNCSGVLEVEAGGSVLRPVADVPSGGDWPRHHLIRDGLLHVAHERSGDVVTFPLDPESGLPGTPADRLDVPSPTALVAAAVKSERLGQQAAANPAAP